MQNAVKKSCKNGMKKRPTSKKLNSRFSFAIGRLYRLFHTLNSRLVRFEIIFKIAEPLENQTLSVHRYSERKMAKGKLAKSLPFIFVNFVLILYLHLSS